ncbi:MerR family transcriptional regulator [Culicoidibacter larvae]|nr:MerR family transcriptional regulator [Culicoidibacter larvae]
MYTVKQMAELSSVSVKTLYHYQKVGILMPAQIDENGYRYYDDEQIKTLQKILFYKELGFSLEKIREMQQEGLSPVAELKRQRELLQAQRVKLTEVLKTIDKTIKSEEQHKDLAPREYFVGLKKDERANAVMLRVLNTGGMWCDFVFGERPLASSQFGLQATAACVLGDDELSFYGYPVIGKKQFEHPFLRVAYTDIQSIELSVRRGLSGSLIKNYSMMVKIRFDDYEIVLRDGNTAVSKEFYKLAAKYDFLLSDPQQLIDAADIMDRDQLYAFFEHLYAESDLDS